MWKLQDQQAEDITADKYDYIYNRTRFAKMMYSNFAHTVDKYLRDGTALEIGCGTGTVSNLLKSKANVQVMDFSRNMLQVAKDKLGDRCVQGDMEHLPYTDHSFDVVFANSTLHHFPSLDGVVSEVFRILKPSGYVLIQEPPVAEIKKDMLLRVLAFGFRKLGIKKYPSVEHLEVKPSDHHAPLPMETLDKSLIANGINVESQQLHYYSSFLFAGFDSSLAHSIGKLLDLYYVRNRGQGYSYVIIGWKSSC